MPLSYRIDRERRTLFTRAAGVLGDEGLRLLWRVVLRDPELSRRVNELHDLTGVTAVEISSALVWEFADEMKVLDGSERHSGVKMATVAARDVLYGLARMYETLRAESSAEFGVFRSMAEAREWLGLPATRDDFDGDWKEVCS